MSEFFSAISPALYDLSLPCVVPGLYPAREIRARIWLEALANTGSWVGADLGIGTGSDVASMLPASSRGTLYGFDDSAGLTKELRETKRLPGEGHAGVQVEVILGDLSLPSYRLPAKVSNACDFVTSSFAIHNISYDDQRRVFQHASQLLRPGGWFIYLDLVGYENASVECYAHRYDLEFIEREMRRAVPASISMKDWDNLRMRWLRHYSEENFLLSFCAAEGRPCLTAMFADAGFSSPTLLYRLLHTTLVIAVRTPERAPLA